MKRLLTPALALLLVGCGTVRSTFGDVSPNFTDVPVDDLRAVAADIESIVIDGRRDAEISGSGGVSVDSNIVSQAVRARSARSELVATLRDSAFAWEKRDGMLWLIKSKEYARELNRREKDRNALVINGENENRWALYEELIKVNNWAPRNLSAVQLIFHEERLKLMPSGQLYERPSGERAAVGS